MATYAIGDIQGCFDELQLLLTEINFTSTDRLWFVGDLVNRGPKSLETLRFVKSLGNRAKVVLGNHDLHLLAIYFSAAKLKTADTLQGLLDAKDCDENVTRRKKVVVMGALILPGKSGSVSTMSTVTSAKRIKEQDLLIKEFQNLVESKHKLMKTKETHET